MNTKFGESIHRILLHEPVTTNKTNKKLGIQEAALRTLITSVLMKENTYSNIRIWKRHFYLKGV